MRIDHIQAATQVYQDKSKVKSAEKASKSVTDQLVISQAGRDYQIAKKAVTEVPDVREDLVAQLKDRIEQGTYQVSAEEFATKVIERYSQFIV